ncbi:ABC transporter permease [Paenibacillus sp. NEAU-GSW1]|uniref:ABC transporter permease n=1 Tax=Paenibacillus sp. NEAU-GSW1 TaxID=2682486 RepID=UPI0012E2D1AE|nr:ABC transporter permease [Paenibacillus sp. NEAU-GSW1]MUT66450.1 ABC transporter permease subunit [Paenibacillus sp. NEAU-GSW1]
MRNDGMAAKGLNGWRSKLINPVLDKEFRLRMRSARSMWTMFAYLLAIGLFAFCSIYLTQEMSGNSNAFDPERSRVLFYALSFAQLGLITFMAPGLTAGVVSGEREKQTLNLLLTTQQSSTTIILSKLVSSLGFMVLIVVSTIPVYGMMFLYGGISPSQLLLVFLFYFFMMIVLGSFGILFSTLFKRTMISVIVTYGLTLFIYVGTLLIFYVFMTIENNMYSSSGQPPASMQWVGHILAWNPGAALYSILEPSITQELYSSVSGNTGANKGKGLQLWQEFMIIYAVLSAGALWLSIVKLRPRLKRRSNK